MLGILYCSKDKNLIPYLACDIEVSMVLQASSYLCCLFRVDMSSKALNIFCITDTAQTVTLLEVLYLFNF